MLIKYGRDYNILAFMAEQHSANFLGAGSPARISPDIIVTDDPVLYRMMTAPRSPFLRGRWFKGMRLGAGQDNVLSMTDEVAHAELRAKLMPGV